MGMKIAVFGAGLVGTYLGGSLLATGSRVVLIGRERTGIQLARDGLRLSDLRGNLVDVAASTIDFRTDPAALAGSALILLTVKSADTAGAAALIRQHADPSAIVLSCQNGIGNVELLRQQLPNRTVLAAMVPFNVARSADGRLHRGTAGDVMAEASPALHPWLPSFAQAGLPLQLRADMQSVQWGKLLLNLNNAVNALAGIPLRAELSQRDYRRCLACLIEEALGILQHAGLRPARLARVAPRWLPAVLRLPDWLFQRLASAMLRIDPEARSSMWEDLHAGRRTEVDYLNGAVIELALDIGHSAPCNERIVELIYAAEQGGEQNWPASRLLAQLTGQRARAQVGKRPG